MFWACAIAFPCLFYLPQMVLAVSVRISYPPPDRVFVVGMRVQIQVDVTGVTEPIAEVRFATPKATFAVVTNPPYSTWLFLAARREEAVTAAVVTTTHNTIISEPAKIIALLGPPPFFEYEIMSPSDGEIILPGQPFTFSAGVLALPDGYDNGPGTIPHLVRFVAGTNIVASFAYPPYSAGVTNLPIGSYTPSVAVRATSSSVKPIHIWVAELGTRSPRVSASNVAFEVVTAFPGKKTIIETSADLREWSSISTNVPATNSFHFVDPNPTGAQARYYRVVIPPE